MDENASNLIRLLSDYSNHPNTIHNLINNNPTNFITILHDTFTYFRTLPHDFQNFPNQLLLILVMLEKIIEKTNLKNELKQSENKFILSDIILCAEYTNLHSYVLDLLNLLSKEDLLMTAVIETELYTLLSLETLSEDVKIGIKAILLQYGRHASKPSSPRRTPSNKENKPSEFWQCIASVTTQISTVIDNIQNSQGLPIPLSPPRIHISFVSQSLSDQLVSAKDSEELVDALDEMLGAYKALSEQKRMDISEDAAVIIHQLVQNLSSSNSVWIVTDVVIRALLFLDSLSEQHTDLFLSDTSKLFYRLEDFALDERPSVKYLAYKLMRSLILRLSCSQTLEIVKSVFSHDRSNETIVIGTIYLLSLLSSQITSKNPSSPSKDDIRGPRSTIGALTRIVLTRSLEYITSSSTDPPTIDSVIDSLSIGILISCPIASNKDSYMKILDDTSNAIATINQPPSLLPNTFQSSYVYNDAFKRAKTWTFLSIQRDRDIMSILKTHHSLLYEFLEPLPPTPSTAKFIPFPISPKLNSSNNSNSNSSNNSNNNNSSNTTDKSVIDPYLPSWANKDISLGDSFGSSSVQTVVSSGDHEFESPQLSLRSPMGGYDLPESILYPQGTSSPSLPSESLDQSKLVSLKRNTGSRRLSTRRAHTASETLQHHVIEDAYTRDVIVPTIRIPPSTSDGIRKTPREGDDSESIASVSSYSLPSTGTSTRRSSTSTRGAGLKLRRRQRLFNGSVGSSPYESDASDSMENEPIMVSQSIQDEQLLIAQARQALEVAASGSSLLQASDGSSSSNTTNTGARTITTTNTKFASMTESDINKKNVSSIPSISSVTSTPERRRPSVRSRSSSGNESSLDRPIMGGNGNSFGNTNGVRSRRKSNSITSSEDFEEVDESESLASLTTTTTGITISPDSSSNNNSSKSPDGIDISPRHPPRSIPKSQSRSTRKSEDGIISDGIASIDISTNSETIPIKEITSSNEISSNMKGSVEYLESHQIQPISNPSSQLQSVLQIFDTETDWEKLFSTLNTMRSLCLHHQQQILSSGKLHTIVLGIMKQIDNLRSAVAKNAILTMGDMYQGLGKAMEPEVAATIPTLIKRFGLSSSFLSESAETALVQMSQNVSATCAMSALLLGIDNRNASIRGKVMALISGLIERKGEELIGTRELEILKTKLGKLYSDSSPEARAYCRNTVRLLLTKEITQLSELEAIVSVDGVMKSLREGSIPVGGVSRSNSISSSSGSSRRSISEMENGSFKVGSTRSSLTNERLRGSFSRHSSVNSGTDTPESMKSDGIPSSGIIGSGRVSVRKLFSSIPESSPLSSRGTIIEGNDNSTHTSTGSNFSAILPEELDELLKGLNGPSWSDRKESLDRITEEILKNSAAIRHMRKYDVCMEAMIDKLQDGSIKVVIHTLTCFQRILAYNTRMLSSQPAILIPALMSSSCSANKTVATQATVLLQEYISSLPRQQVVQQLCLISLHDKERVRAQAFRLLAENMTSYCESDPTDRSSSDTNFVPSFVKEIVFPAIVQTLSANFMKPEVTQGATEALRSLQKVMDTREEKIWLWVDDKKQQENLKKILGV